MIKSVLSLPERVIKRANRELFNLIEFLYFRFLYKKPQIKGHYGISRLILDTGEDRADLSDSFKRWFPHHAEEKIRQADLICEHVFDLLNSGAVKLSSDGTGYQRIDWHSDFKSGYKWDPSTFYKCIEFWNLDGADIKVPWELSYFHHATIIGQAYLLTGDEKYAKEYENQITDWVNNNKIVFGIGWSCTMIVAIRAINWLVALEYFSVGSSISREFLNRFYSSIYEHGKFIRSHLEYSPGATTNHYLFNLAGLFFISVYCPFFKESNKWREFALNELCREMEKQVYDDGCNFEASTSYHRFVLEMFFYVDLIGRKSGIEYPETWEEKLKKMFEFSLYCVKPDGTVPQVGDNDSGRFIVLSKKPVLEHKYLLSIAAVYFEESRFKLKHFDLDEEAFWVFGKRAKTVWNQLLYREDVLKIKSFRDAGWYIIRNNNDYCFISCGYNGQNGNGGHAHNDKLSFELVMGGVSVVVDPGTYVYTPDKDERNKFRSTEYHNTVKFSGHEQNEIPDGLFLLTDRVKILNAQLKEMDDACLFEGEIRYAGFAQKRIIILDKRSCRWEIIDNLSCPYPVKAHLRFHISPDLKIDGNDILRKKTGEGIASLSVEGYELEKGKYEYSPAYGLKEEAECFIVHMDINQEYMTVNTVINKI